MYGNLNIAMRVRKRSKPRYGASSGGWRGVLEQLLHSFLFPGDTMLCVHLDEVGERVVDVGSFRQEEAASRAHVIEEE